MEADSEMNWLNRVQPFDSWGSCDICSSYFWCACKLLNDSHSQILHPVPVYQATNFQSKKPCHSAISQLADKNHEYM